MKRSLFLSAIIFSCASALAAEPAAKSAHPPGHQMEPAKASGAAIEHCGLPMGEGVIGAVDVAKSRATIAHKAIPALGWDEMTMGFAVEKTVDLAAFAAGDRVHFLLTPDKKPKSQKIISQNIVAMCAADADAGAHEACMGAMHQTAMKIADAAGAPCAMEGMDHGAMGHGDAAKPKDAAAKTDGEHGDH